MSCKRAEIVHRARAYLGKNEADGSHKEIVALYNSHTPLARGYGLKATDPWCAATVSALAIACNATDIIPTEVGCGELLALFERAGDFLNDPGYIPDPGDIIFYDWQKNMGAPDHVGIVEKVEGDTITVIEGNYKNAVGRRAVKVGDSRIRGYGLPKYTDWVCSVQAVQRCLNARYAAQLSVDGIYGKKTKAALIAALQKTLSVEETGVYDEETVAAVKKNNLRRGDRGAAVEVLQALLICNGYECAYADGVFGSGTKKALRAYQLKKGLFPDGIAGSKTFRKLFA